MSCWYLVTAFITPVYLGYKSLNVGEINQLTNDRYDHFQQDTLVVFQNDPNKTLGLEIFGSHP